MGDGRQGDTAKVINYIDGIKNKNPECAVIALFTKHHMKGDPRVGSPDISGKSHLGTNGVMVNPGEGGIGVLAHEIGHLGNYGGDPSTHSNDPNNIMASPAGVDPDKSWCDLVQRMLK